MCTTQTHACAQPCIWGIPAGPQMWSYVTQGKGLACALMFVNSIHRPSISIVSTYKYMWAHWPFLVSEHIFLLNHNSYTCAFPRSSHSRAQYMCGCTHVWYTFPNTLVHMNRELHAHSLIMHAHICVHVPQRMHSLRKSVVNSKLKCLTPRVVFSPVSP